MGKMIVHLTHRNWEICAPVVCSRLKCAKFVTALTGAGISVASGLPLTNDRIRDVEVSRLFEAQFLQENRQMYFSIYRDVLKTWREAEPNAAHVTLARNHVWTITLNIDGLHRAAGTQHLIELHGNLRELNCRSCSLTLPSEVVVSSRGVPACPHCGIVLWPGFSLSGEAIRHFNRAVDWAARSEVLFVVGTSLEAEPAAHLPAIADRSGGCVVFIQNDADEMLPRLYRALI